MPCFNYIGWFFSLQALNDLFPFSYDIKTLRSKKFINYLQNHTELSINGTKQNYVYHFQKLSTPTI